MHSLTGITGQRQKCRYARCRLVTHIIGDVWAPGQGGFNVPCRSGHRRAVEPTAHWQAALVRQNFWHLQKPWAACHWVDSDQVSQVNLWQEMDSAPESPLHTQKCQTGLDQDRLSERGLSSWSHCRFPEFQSKLLLQAHRKSILPLPLRALSCGFLR